MIQENFIQQTSLILRVSHTSLLILLRDRLPYSTTNMDLYSDWTLILRASHISSYILSRDRLPYATTKTDLSSDWNLILWALHFNIDPLKRQATVFYHKHGSLFWLDPHPFANLFIDPHKRQASVFYHKHGSLFWLCVAYKLFICLKRPVLRHGSSQETGYRIILYLICRRSLICVSFIGERDKLVSPLLWIFSDWLILNRDLYI